MWVRVQVWTDAAAASAQEIVPFGWAVILETAIRVRDRIRVRVR